MWRSRWRCVIKPAYSFSFLLSINIFVWQNVLYFLDAPRIRPGYRHVIQTGQRHDDGLLLNARYPTFYTLTALWRQQYQNYAYSEAKYSALASMRLPYDANKAEVRYVCQVTHNSQVQIHVHEVLIKHVQARAVRIADWASHTTLVTTTFDLHSTFHAKGHAICWTEWSRSVFFFGAFCKIAESEY